MFSQLPIEQSNMQISAVYSRIFLTVSNIEDAHWICYYVKNLYPRAECIKIKQVDEPLGFLVFFSYKTFEDSCLIRNLINGKTCLISENRMYKFDVKFAFHTNEVCSYFMFRSEYLKIEDFAKIFEKYPTFLGYRKVAGRNALPTSISFLARFMSVEDCCQSIQELRQCHTDMGPVIGCFSHHDEENIRDYIMTREKNKSMENIPEFHQFYNKKPVTIEEFNEITMQQSEAWFTDVEDSRWSYTPYTHNLHETDCIIDMSWDHFNRF